jgi:hypothetical protein
MLDILKKIFLGPIAAILSLLANPLGWIVLGVGGYFMYTIPSGSTFMAVSVVWATIGYGMMPDFTDPDDDQ